MAQTTQGWALQCDASANCQILSQTSQNGILSQIALEIRDSAPFVQIMTPLGINLGTALGLQIDNGPLIDIAPTTCESMGCLF